MGSEDNSLSLVEQILNNVRQISPSPTHQLILGSGTGLVTGYIFTKVGKTVSFAIGGGIIVLQLCFNNGIINVNWNKIDKNINDASDSVNAAVTGTAPSLINKMERYVDRKIDKAENIVKKQQKKAKRWYRKNIKGEEEFILKDTIIFVTSFFVGFGFAVITS